MDLWSLNLNNANRGILSAKIAPLLQKNTCFERSFSSNLMIKVGGYLGGDETRASRSKCPAYRSLAAYLPTKDNLKRKEIDREVCNILRCMIEKREKAMKRGEAKNDDLLGLLLESNFKESQQNSNSKSVGMSIEDVMDECRLFYFAGQETTSSLLTWTMVTLAMHPSWQECAREEVFQVYGMNKLDFDGLSHLKTVSVSFHVMPVGKKCSVGG